MTDPLEAALEVEEGRARRQAIFTRVWDHFVTNGAPLSVYEPEDENEMYSDRVQCRLRGEGGSKCAIGLFIPDERYDETLEGEQIETLYRQEYLEDGVEADDLRLLADLRNAHDDAAGMGYSIESLLREAAEAYGLSIPA